MIKHLNHLYSQTINNNYHTIKRLFRVALFSFLSVCVLIVGYHLIFARRIIPGVVIGNVKVGGLTYEQALDLLKTANQKNPKVITLRIGEKVYQITDKDIELEYNLDASITRAFEIGRTGNLLNDNRDKLAGIFKPLYIKSFNQYNNTALNNELLIIKGEVNIPVVDASYQLDGKDLLVTKSVNGKAIDGEALYVAVQTSIDKMDFATIQIPVKSTTAKLNEFELEAIKTDAKKIIYNPITITYKTKKWVLTPKDMLGLILIRVDEDNQKPEITINQDQFVAYANTFSSEITESPRGKVDVDEMGKVKNFVFTQGGKQIDVPKFTTLFKNSFLLTQKNVEIPTQNVSMEEDIKKYGITTLLSEGTSKYVGSITSRVHNLTLAAERTNGVLVAPGAIYSFNKAVGDISGATGYNAAYVISNGRTVLGEGGGVCQTSTTLFRAALKAGLPIVTRFPHAYRVKYYEQDSPAGIDAAVYQPSLDFQFKNDTPAYILVTSSADVPNSTLSFKIYGTPDGRTVEMSEPIISNVTAPPETLYQDDTSLAKGTLKQVDFPAWGATAQFTRTVKKDGQVVSNDTFTSRYQAWRAVFLKGTKD